MAEVEFGLSYKIPAKTTAQTLNQTSTLDRGERLPQGHSADPQSGSNVDLSREFVPRLHTARNDQPLEPVADTSMRGEVTRPTEDRKRGEDLILHRQRSHTLESSRLRHSSCAG